MTTSFPGEAAKYRAARDKEPPDPDQEPRHGETTDPLWDLFDFAPEGRGTNWYPDLVYGCAVSATAMLYLILIYAVPEDTRTMSPPRHVLVAEDPMPHGFRVAALPQPRQHVPGDLFDLGVSAYQPVSPVGRPGGQHRGARLVRVRAQHRVAVADAFHRLGLTRPEHA